MSSEKTSRPRRPRSVLKADKERYTIAEVAPEFAKVLGVSEAAAKAKIYRAINDGRLRAVRYLGAVRLPRGEVQRIIHGEPY